MAGVDHLKQVGFSIRPAKALFRKVSESQEKKTCETLENSKWVRCCDDWIQMSGFVRAT
jgi:hypothetical protein